MSLEQKQADPTRERLLDEAEKLFARKGFDGVSVREITAKAGAHLSAINYHFGTKKNLYLAVFEERWIPRAKRVADRVSSLDQANTSVEGLIRTVAEGFLGGFNNEKERQVHQQLIHREMNQPTEALAMIAEKVTKPFFMNLRNIIRRHLPAHNGNEETFLCIFSVFSQIIFFNFGRNIVSLLTGSEYDQAFQDRVVDHITNFSLYGLNGLSAES